MPLAVINGIDGTVPVTSRSAYRRRSGGDLFDLSAKGHADQLHLID